LNAQYCLQRKVALLDCLYFRILYPVRRLYMIGLQVRLIAVASIAMTILPKTSVRALFLLLLSGAMYPVLSDTKGNRGETLQHLFPEILAVYPHDPKAFTQGLVFHQGRLYESTGLYGSSELRRVELKTGKVTQRLRLNDRFFGEGLALVGDRLIQLTWVEKTAFVYDLNTFALLESHRYESEGWGLCFDGFYLYRSDGSHLLFRHDSHTFEMVGTLPITMQGRAIANLNELACVGPHIYANVYMTDTIVRIDKNSGRVTARIDAANLLPARERAALPAGATLNGIAHDPEEDVFYLTGKLWPKLFKVRFR
jgi:glutaminyl-peptide cyclotransferase